MKRPWRAHYTKDWRTDPFVRGLNLEARMVYAELLDIAWDEGGLRLEWIATGAYVAQQIGITRRKFVSIWPSIRDKFVEYSPGFWSNSRLEMERNKSQEFSEKQRNNVNSRYTESTNVVPRGRELVLPSQSQSQSQHSTEERKKKRPKAPPTELYQVVEAWKAGWAERFKPVSGRAPEPNDADWKQVKSLLKAHGLADTLALVTRFLDDTDPFVAERGHILRDLPSRVARYQKGAQTTLRVGRASPAEHNEVSRDATEDLA